MSRPFVSTASACTALLLAAVLGGCEQIDSKNAAAVGLSAAVTPLTSQGEARAEPAETWEWTEEAATKITLSGDSIEVTGPGAAANGSKVTITTGGDYVLSGALNSGQVVVNAGKDDKVRLVLMDVSLHNGKGAAINAIQSGLLVITLPQDTESRVSDAQRYLSAGTDAREPDAAIYSGSALILEGEGSLAVNGSYRGGIGTAESLTVTGGQYNVTAPDHGLRGQRGVLCTGGAFTVETGGVGIRTDSDGDSGKGGIRLIDGVYKITSGGDGIKAAGSLTVEGGDYELLCGVDDQETGDSGKGLRAGRNLTVTGGAFSIHSREDCLYAGDIIQVEDGGFSLSSQASALRAAGDVKVSGGAMDILACSEAMNGKAVTVTGGEIHLVSAEAGGTAGQEPADSPRATGGKVFTIEDGRLVVDAGREEGNPGNVVIKGGMVLVNGPSEPAEDLPGGDGVFSIRGGVLVAAGSEDLSRLPGSSSTQPSLIVVFDDPQPADTLVNLSTADGDNVLSFVPSREYQAILFSTPELAVGGAYRVSTGGTDSGSLHNGCYQGGQYSDGEAVVEATISAINNRVDEFGDAVTDPADADGNRPAAQSPTPADPLGQ